MQSQTIDAGLEVEFASGDDRIRGVVHAPDRSPSPALVLLPDVRGISPLYLELAARFAGAGFRTLVLDIYSREGTPDLADMAAAFSVIDALPDARVIADVQAAVHHLAERPEVHASAVGVVGFCVGGQYAMMAACRVAGLAACVAFYGMLRHRTVAQHKLPPPLDTFDDLSCPLLGLFGAEDGLIPREDVESFARHLAHAGKTFDVRIFEGAGHAFVNDRRPEAYRPEAAETALSLAIEFLYERLA
ncbi:MAG: dienelactone hydrolase family protein [Thermodesulfobacteriota bacterium]